jgi:hypothetical protein
MVRVSRNLLSAFSERGVHGSGISTLFANLLYFPKSLKLSTKSGHFEIGRMGANRCGLSTIQIFGNIYDVLPKI